MRNRNGAGGGGGYTTGNWPNPGKVVLGATKIGSGNPGI